MTQFSRRGLMLAFGGVALTAACNNGVGSNGQATLDARVDQTINYLYDTYPGTREVAAKSVGQLVMPLVTEAGFGFGGGYGRGGSVQQRQLVFADGQHGRIAREPALGIPQIIAPGEERSQRRPGGP